MSSILKALRKLEEEKSVRQESNVDIARDILRLPARRSGNRSRLVSAGIIVICLTAGFAGFLFVAGLPSSGIGDVPESLSRPLPTAHDAPPEGSQSALATSRVVPEEKIAEERIDRRPPVAVRERASLPRVVPLSPAAPPVSPHAASSAPAEPPQGADSLNFPSPPATGSAVPPSEPAFRLSGIAWQSDPEARLAVLNNLPVMQGTVIEGAVVEEILTDRIRLRRDGRALEILMD